MAKVNKETGEVTLSFNEVMFLGAGVVFGEPDRDKKPELYGAWQRFNNLTEDLADELDIDEPLDFEDEDMVNGLFIEDEGPEDIHTILVGDVLVET